VLIVTYSVLQPLKCPFNPSGDPISSTRLKPVGVTVSDRELPFGLMLSRVLSLPLMQRTPPSTSTDNHVHLVEREAALPPDTPLGVRAPATPTPPSTPGVTLFEGNVRSGQQVYAAPGASLLVIGSVNPGGEVRCSFPFNLHFNIMNGHG
jgi:hypothetical protein